MDILRRIFMERAIHTLAPQPAGSSWVQDETVMGVRQQGFGCRAKDPNPVILRRRGWKRLSVFGLLPPLRRAFTATQNDQRQATLEFTRSTSTRTELRGPPPRLESA